MHQITLGQLAHNVTYLDYAATEGLRSGWLQELRRSPAHLKASIDSPREATPALILGQKIHSALENMERFFDCAVVEPVFIGKTKDGKDSAQSAEAKAKRAAWRADRGPNDIVLTQEELDMIKGIISSIQDHRLCRNLLSKGIKETSLWVKDPETGLTLKCRPDFIHEAGFLVDYKSTRDASRRSFQSDIFSEFKSFYILNAAHYVHCLKLAGVGRRDEATLIALEKEPPYALNVFPLDAGQLDHGERWRASLTRKYAECLATNTWPRYSDEYPENAVPVEIPQYARYPEESGS